MTTRTRAALAVTVIMAAMALGLFVAAPGASASGETIPLDLELGEAVALDATVTADQVSVENGTLIVEGTLDGTATVLGASATIPSQTFTLTATATCKKGKGTLTLSTSQIEASLDGQSVTVQPATVTVAATCGRTPTLTVTLEPLTATVDGTTISTSRCTLTVSSEASSAIGQEICSLKNLICELADLLAQPDATTEDLAELLNQVLEATGDAATI